MVYFSYSSNEFSDPTPTGFSCTVIKVFFGVDSPPELAPTLLGWPLLPVPFLGKGLPLPRAITLHNKELH